jgi:hypothetical protein
MTKVLSVLAAVAVLGATAASQAATINLTGSVGQSLAGGNTGTVNNAGGTGVNMTVTASTGGKITWQSGDGLGVQSSADKSGNAGSSIPDDWESTTDEVNGGETLTIGFSEGVKIQSIGLTDLYSTSGNFNYLFIPDEAGSWVLKDKNGNAVATGAFVGAQDRTTTGNYWTGTPTNGVLTVNLTQVIASAVTLASTVTAGYESWYKGFSVGSVTFETVKKVSVPELSASGMANAGFLLFGAAMLLTGAKRRKLA